MLTVDGANDSSPTEPYFLHWFCSSKYVYGFSPLEMSGQSEELDDKYLIDAWKFVQSLAG